MKYNSGLKKILLIFAILFVQYFFFLISPSFAKGKFIEVNLDQQDNALPVILNEEQLFFIGGYRYKKNTGNQETIASSAKIYDIKNKEIIALNSYLNVTRENYGAIKYDNDNILILGGQCPLNNNKQQCINGKVAENYNINANIFKRLEDLPIHYNVLTPTSTLIQINQKIYIVTTSGIMSFDTKTKKFEKLIEYDERFIAQFYSAKLLDSDNILIWGGHYKDGISYLKDEAYYTSIIKYNISSNKIVELLTIDLPRWQNPISLPGIPLDNNNIMFLSGDQDGGTIYIYNYLKNKIENHGKTKFGINSTKGIYLGNNKVLLFDGVIDTGDEPLIPPKGLEYGILDLKTKKFSNIKISRDVYSRYLLPISKNRVYIGWGKGKPVIYNYEN